MKYAIFDLDGTIVDSMKYWRGVRNAFLEEHNLTSVDNFNDFTGADWVEKLCEYFNSKYNMDMTPEKFMDWGIEYMMKKYANDVYPKAGALELLDKFYAEGVKMCICSSTDRYMMEPVLEKFDLDKYFQFTIHCRQFGKEKNDPDTFRYCMERLGAQKPEEVAVFEDAHYAASTAKNAGFYVVGMYDANEPKTEEVKAFVDQYVTDYAQLDYTRFPK